MGIYLLCQTVSSAGSVLLIAVPRACNAWCVPGMNKIVIKSENPLGQNIHVHPESLHPEMRRERGERGHNP